MCTWGAGATSSLLGEDLACCMPMLCGRACLGWHAHVLTSSQRRPVQPQGGTKRVSNQSPDCRRGGQGGVGLRQAAPEEARRRHPPLQPPPSHNQARLLYLPEVCVDPQGGQALRLAGEAHGRLVQVDGVEAEPGHVPQLSVALGQAQHCAEQSKAGERGGSGGCANVRKQAWAKSDEAEDEWAMD